MCVCVYRQALSVGGVKSSCDSTKSTSIPDTPCIRPLSYVHNINLTNSSAEFTVSVWLVSLALSVYITLNIIYFVV